MTRTRRPAPVRWLRKKSGFALLAVIWGTGVIALLVVSFMSTGRLRLQTAHNIASATRASYIAEGVINLTAISLLAQHDSSAIQPDAVVHDGAPTYCVFDGAAIALAIEDEGGKVDLNAAPDQLLQALLEGLGLDAKAASAVASAIIDFRSSPADDIARNFVKPKALDKPFGPKKALFETILELDQVSGIDSTLFRELLPFATVHSHSAGVDAQAAPPALFATLAGFPPQEIQSLKTTPFPNALNRKDPRFPANFKQPGEHGAFLVHAEALLATGQTAAKDAIIDLRGGSGGQLAMKELRRGQSHYLERLRAMIANNGAGVPDC